MGVIQIACLLVTPAELERTMDKELNSLHVFSRCLSLDLSLPLSILSQILRKFDLQECFSTYFFVS